MPKRQHLTATVSASHPETGYPAEYAEITDVQAVYIEIPEMPWLGRIVVSFEPGRKGAGNRPDKFAKVEVEVQLTADDQTHKTLTVDDAGYVTFKA